MAPATASGGYDGPIQAPLDTLSVGSDAPGIVGTGGVRH